MDVFYYIFVCMSGFKHFTDYRCFHFARRDFTERGVTKTVAICECKPDACSPVFGNTQLRAGALDLKVYINLPIVSFKKSLYRCAVFGSRRHCASNEGPIEGSKL